MLQPQAMPCTASTSFKRQNRREPNTEPNSASRDIVSNHLQFKMSVRISFSFSKKKVSKKLSVRDADKRKEFITFKEDKQIQR